MWGFHPDHSHGCVLMSPWIVFSMCVCVCVCATVPLPSLWEHNLGAECSSVAFVVGNVIAQLPRDPLKKQIWLLWGRNTQRLVMDGAMMREADAAPADTTSFSCVLIISNASRETQFLLLGSLGRLYVPYACVRLPLLQHQSATVSQTEVVLHQGTFELRRFACVFNNTFATLSHENLPVLIKYGQVLVLRYLFCGKTRIKTLLHTCGGSNVQP